MYKERRERLLQQLPDYSIAVFMAGHASYNIGDEKNTFDVDRSYFYFTGLDKENQALVLVKTPKGNQQILFIEPFDPLMAKWVGGRILPEKAREISGIEDIRYTDALERTLFTFVNTYDKSSQFVLYGELSKMEISQQIPVGILFKKIMESHPDVTCRNISAITTRMRNIKDEHELAQMGKAIEFTNQGIKAMMKASHDNIWENELEAHFDFVLKCNQCGHAFHTICAAGKRATVLHYGDNNQPSGESELVLIDLGASYGYYNADISRTFPNNGKFTERQKEVYETVLRANKMVMEIARPGLTTRDLNNAVIEFYKQELPKIGLTLNGDKVSDYYYHGVSHHLGLETHDVSLMDEPLKPGCVITDEPGLYIEAEGIGVRIEDDILITEDGCRCLSSNIMKEVADIEAFMKG